MAYRLPEPSRREDKPPFDAVPAALLDKIKDLLGSPVATGDIVYGGFSPSAGYRLTLEDGRKIFAKGTHPAEMSHGAATLRQEIHAYRKIGVLKDIAPRYHGFVADGDEDGWMLGFWDYIEQSPAPLQPVQLADMLVRMQADTDAGKNLEQAEKRNFIEFFFASDRKWKRIAAESKIREKFLTLFKDSRAADDWLSRNLSVLCALQDRIGEVSRQSPRGLLHGDLRLDNIMQDKNAHLFIADWPNACYGPAVFDVAFLCAHAAASGIAPLAALFSLYHDRGGAFISTEHRHIMICSIAGFFADQAYRQVPERLPRLRWMQKIMLISLLESLHLDGVIESIPDFAG